MRGPGYPQAEAHYRHIHINLLSHGVRSPGSGRHRVVGGLAQRYAAESGEVIGADREAYPLDAGSTLRYNAAFRAMPYRQPTPAPLTISDVDTFAAQRTDRRAASWL